MRFGVNTLLWTENFAEKDYDLLPTIRDHGFTGIELFLLEPATFQAGVIRRNLEAHGLESTVCAIIPAHLSFLSDDPSVRQRTIVHVAECIRVTAETGSKIIAGPLYSPVGYLPGRRRTNEEWKRAVDAYQQLGPVLADSGVHLAIEPLNRFETYFLNLTADAVQLCGEVAHPNVGILWDTFHANIEEKSLRDSLLSAGPYLKHVHTCENDRGTPGSGHVDWPGVFQALSILNYDEWLTIESFGFALGNLSAAASIWRDLATTPEQIAWDGIQFLKTQVAGTKS